ncbi:mechanosensitive ion channel family protein [Alkalicoccobacillus porphyridii]|uniref:Mechanosensitive ion channel family protein n=1 Tax=Alkalicoccobacillus porphyridii TaxID=2597270 RepID=A0A553ZV07_9BACI|nr:mechanosensitive ion channel family protein [Alkalicoccobacillus porphyridii]TSB45321.1 mechanosensitive ion channel family protein [Alkalicoccobacillus porphyridii]
MELWNNFVDKVVNLDWINIGISIAIFLVFLVFRKLFTTYFNRIILRLSKRASNRVIMNILRSYEKPLRLLWAVIGTYLAFQYLNYWNITDEPFVSNLYRSFIIFVIGWGLFNYTSNHSTVIYRFAQKAELEEESMLIPFLSKILRFLVVAVTLVIILDNWNFDISTFVAGLGIGGLAFALAAQDSIGNFFGGIIIITERPFKKGDWIETPTVEGAVEDITFRSTKIRTFSDTLVIIPNSTLANEAITNWTEMERRRVYFSLGIRHSTSSQKLQLLRDRIETELQTFKGIADDTVIVRFEEFTETGYNLMVTYFTETNQWGPFMEIREEAHFGILRILEEEGIHISTQANLMLTEDQGLVVSTDNEE